MKMQTYYFINGELKEKMVSSRPTEFPRYNGVWGEDKRIVSFPLNSREFPLNPYLTPRASKGSMDDVKVVIEYDGQESECSSSSMRVFLKDLMERRVNYRVYMVKNSCRHRIPACENGQEHGKLLLSYQISSIKKSLKRAKASK